MYIKDRYVKKICRDSQEKNLKQRDAKHTRPLLLLLLLVMAWLLLLTPTPIQAAETEMETEMDFEIVIYSDWTMLPRIVKIHSWAEMSLFHGIELQGGFFVEGHLHQEDRLEVRPDLINITYPTPFGSIQAGLLRPSWGTDSFDSIMLSGEAQAFPSIAYTTSIHFLEYQRFASYFNNRGYFFGHRLGIPLFEGIELGIKETVIYSETFSGFWLNYLPLWPFYLIKYIPAPSTRTHNMNIGLDLRLDYFDDLELYGDFHVSEWPFLPESRQPRLYGLKIGSIYDGFHVEELSLRCTYQRIMNYLYSTRDEAQYYHYRGTSLGSTLGPNADELAVELSYQLLEDLTLFGGLKLGRKGEGEIGDYWSSLDEAHENLFLQGIVEERVTPTIGLKYRLFPELTVEARGEIMFVENLDYKEGEEGTRTFAFCTFTWEF